MKKKAFLVKANSRHPHSFLDCPALSDPLALQDLSAHQPAAAEEDGHLPHSVGEEAAAGSPQGERLDNHLLTDPV